MSYFSTFLRRSAVSATILTIVFYLFALATGFTTASMTFGRYASLLLYGAVIAGAEFLFSIQRLPCIIVRILHFSLLVSGFVLVFLVFSGIGSGTAARNFVLIFLFVIVYILTSFAISGIRRLSLSHGKDRRESK